MIDVRLNNRSQLAGFSKRDDLRYFLREILGIDYIHEPLMAAEKAMFAAYKHPKIGTSRKFNTEGRGYLADIYVTSFAGMLPAAEPDFGCVVLIDDSRTTEVARYGGTSAAPVFSRITGKITKLQAAH